MTEEYERVTLQSDLIDKEKLEMDRINLELKSFERQLKALIHKKKI